MSNFAKRRISNDKVTVGIDPGGQTTGIVAIIGKNLVGHTLCRRDTQPLAQFAVSVGAKVNAIVYDLLNENQSVTVKIEEVVPPKGRVKGKRAAINPGSLIGVSMVYGAILNELASIADHLSPRLAIVLIAPRKHGSTPATLTGQRLHEYMHGRYPQALLPSAPDAKYSDIMRHCRSAYDIAMYPKGKVL